MKHIRTWAISDDFWALVEPLLPASRRDPTKQYRRKPGGGRKSTYSDRTYFSGIVYVLRTGIQWNAFPRREFEGLGSSALHARFQEWERNGFFLAVWKKGLAVYDELEGIAWEWQSADGVQAEAPLAQESAGPNPTDWGKKRKQAHARGGRAWRPALARRQRGERA